MPYWGRMAGFGAAPQQQAVVTPPTPPPVAAQYGLTNRTFFDDFTSLSTIDLGNTGAPGFNWYPQCNFSTNWLASSGAGAGTNILTVSAQTYGPGNYLPNGSQIQNFTNPGSIPTPTFVVSGGGNSSGSYTLTLSQNIAGTGVHSSDAIVANYPPQPTGTLSIVSQAGSTSVLKMSNVGQAESNYGMGTVYVFNANNTTYNGFTTGQNKSFYVRWRIAFDESLAPSNFGTGFRWPALSSYSYPGTTGGATLEIDIPDLLSGPAGTVALSYFLHELAPAIDQVSYANTGRGQIATLGTITGGSGYVNGTYNNVPLYDVNGLTSGSITGATANIVVSGGAVTAVTVVLPGLRANSSETVTTPNSYLGGTGSGFHVPIASVTQLVFQASQFHTFECLCIVTGDNAGVGLFGYYFDGMLILNDVTLQSSVQVSLTGDSNPASTNPTTGEFTSMQTNGTGGTFVIASGQQGGGGDWPLYIDYFECWQKP